jgi:teichuronic acid exporter
MSDSLKSKTINALSWSFIEYSWVHGIRFLVGIILARLLFPEQFGLIGMLGIFIAVAQVFLDSGFGAALIQRQEITQVHICSIFYFNIVIGILATIILFLIAPWVAVFYNQPLLEPMMQVFSIRILIDSLGIIHATTLTKKIDFKTISKISIIAGTGSGVVGVSLAAIGMGVWSLVVQQIASSLLRTVCLWLFGTWRPTLVFSFRSMREMFSFGSNLLISELLNQIFENIYQLVIGKYFSAFELGIFTRAKTLNELPSIAISSMIGNVTFPVFSSLQNDIEKLKNGVKKIHSLITLVNFPLMIGLAVIARPLVLSILTEKWEDCITYFQLFCLSGLVSPLTGVNINVIIALGRSDIYLRLEIIKKVLIILSITITWSIGLFAMICGITLYNFIFFFLSSYYLNKITSYSIKSLLQSTISKLSIAVCMGLIVLALNFISIANNWIMLFIQTIAGFVSYSFLCWIFQNKEFAEIKNILRNQIQKNHNRTMG